MTRRKTTPASRRRAPTPDPIYVLAESTAGEVGAEFLSALVRNMHEVMDLSAAVITRGVGDPPVRARASVSWRKDGLAFPTEYELEGTPCSLVYQGEVIVIPEQLWRRFPREMGFEGYCGVPLRGDGGKVVGHFSVLSKGPIRNVERTEGIMRIFGMRAEAELRRIAAEQERAGLIGRLSHALERLNHQHQLTKEANAFKAEALSMVAHDLRSPLAAIVSRAELIEQILAKLDGRVENAAPQTLRAKLAASCEAIGRSADRMEQMIAGLLSAAREEARSIALRCARIDIADPVHVAIGLNQAAADAKKLRVTEVLGEVAPVVADEDRLIEAVDNLLSNAVKYSKAGGTILVETGTDADGRTAFMRVTDHGEGLSPEDMALAFRRFQRLSAAPTAGEPSTGLGLAIVKAIAEAHGGSIETASAGKGRGSAFTLRIPLSGPGGGAVPVAPRGAG